MTICVICGSTNGFYTNENIVRGNVISVYNSDGTWGDNSGMYDHLVTEAGKHAYCIDCGGYVGKTEKIVVERGTGG
ncbi:TPA_asm: hypothetical protein GZY09_00915 [Listeria monocytogenes]|nr:hypothetical protein [Listeria monocytogenes]